MAGWTNKKYKPFYELSEVPYERKSRERLLTGFSRLDYAIKGFEKRKLSLVVAGSDMGKSTLVQGFILRAVAQRYKTWVFSGEHYAEELKNLFYIQSAQPKDFVCVPFKDCDGKDTNIADWYVTEAKQAEVDKQLNDYIAMYSPKAPRDVDSLIASMEEAYKVGYRFFVVDNLMSIQNTTPNLYVEQSDITEKIRTFTLNHDVMVLLVAHQRKTIQRTFRLDLYDISGSANIANKANNIIVLYRTDRLSPDSPDYKRFEQDLARNGFDIQQCDGVIEVIKTKGNGNALIGIKYNAETHTYSQAEVISKTKADTIYKRVIRQESIDDLREIVADDDELPF